MTDEAPLDNLRYVVVDLSTGLIVKWGNTVRQDLEIQARDGPTNLTGTGRLALERTDELSDWPDEFERPEDLVFDPITHSLTVPS